ncbi:MAG: MFS transporter [Leptolyngbyaceae cyanobacterium bins.302]|nr:MFS transporter [Leptolyngbyaceae cyanobacterium bins.302]
MSAQLSSSFNSRRKTLIGLCLALFVVAFTLGVIPPMMPAIVREFDSSMGYIQSILVLSSLVTASSTPTTENLSNVFGRKKILIAGLILYAIGLLVASLCFSMGGLAIGYALILGVAASPLIDSCWAWMHFLYDDEEERKAGAVMVLCSIAGGVSGGLTAGLIASQISWRVAFLPQLVLLPVIYWLTCRMPYQQAIVVVPVDWIGGLFSLLGLGLTLLGVSLAGEYGWWEPKQLFELAGVVLPPFSLSIVPILIASGLIFLGLFFFWQRQAAKKGLPSLFRAGVLRRKVFVLGVLTAILHSIVTAGVQFNLYQFIPVILKLNAFQTALAVFPYTLATLVAFFTGTYNRNIQAIAPRHLIQIGLTLVCVGVLLLRQAIAPPMTALNLLPALVIMGIGSGTFFTCIAGVAFSVTKRHEKAEANGVYNPLQNVGSSLGRGIFGTVLITGFSSGIVDGVAERLGSSLTPAARKATIYQLQRVIQTFNTEERKEFLGQLPTNVSTELRALVPTVATEAIQFSLLVLFGLSAAGLLLSFALPKGRVNQN